MGDNSAVREIMKGGIKLLKKRKYKISKISIYTQEFQIKNRFSFRVVR